MERKTLQNTAKLTGVGLHTGMPCSMVFKPSEQGYISFIRADLAGSAPVKAGLASVSSTMRGTNLSNGAAEVHTVEHVLSAASAFGITDLILEMDGPEPPVMDGSAAFYAKAMQDAGFKKLPGTYPVLDIKKKVEYAQGNITYSAVPADKTLLTFVYLRPGSIVTRQEYTFELTAENFLKEIAPARTFGFEEEIAFLRAHGLAKGGTKDNCVIISKEGFSTPLRFDNELVRHKILDMVGDFKLMGKALGRLHITCVGGGHKSNVEFGKILLENEG